MKKPTRKTVCIRGFDAKLFAQIKTQAQADDLLVRDWLERAAIYELARQRKLQTRIEAAAAAAEA